MIPRFDCGICGTPRRPNQACRPCANASNRKYKATVAGRAAASRHKKKLHALGAAERAAKKAARRASLRARRQAAKRKWKAANRGAVNAATAKRHALKMEQKCRCCSWKQLETFYVLAGPGMEVDHILPLAVSALLGLRDAHCIQNLQVLPVEAHKEKTRLDRELIARIKREQPAAARGRPGPRQAEQVGERLAA
jgi:hypothetical protein